MATNAASTDRSASGPPADPGLVSGRLRAAAGALLFGGLLFFARVSRPVVRDWAEAFEDEAKRIAVAEADADEFKAGFALMGVGFIVMGIALALWGSAVSRLETGRRATAAIVLSLLAAIRGLGPGLVRIIGPLVDVEQAAGESGALNLAYLPGGFALTAAFVGFGILTWRGPASKWTGAFLAVTGVAAAVTFPAWYMLGALVFGSVGVVRFRRTWSGPAERHKNREDAA